MESRCGNKEEKISQQTESLDLINLNSKYLNFDYIYSCVMVLAVLRCQTETDLKRFLERIPVQLSIIRLEFN